MSISRSWRHTADGVAIFVTINLVVDILYTVVDPRLRSTIRRPA